MACDLHTKRANDKKGHVVLRLGQVEAGEGDGAGGRGGEGGYGTLGGHFKPSMR